MLHYPIACAGIICRRCLRVRRLRSWGQRCAYCVYRICQLAILIGVLSLAGFLLTTDLEYNDIVDYNPTCRFNIESKYVKPSKAMPKLYSCPPSGIQLVDHRMNTIFIADIGIVQSHNLTCYYKANSNWTVFSEPTTVMEKLVYVRCLRYNEVVYQDIFPLPFLSTPKRIPDGQTMNVLVITLGSVSRNSFLIYMPLTRRHFEDHESVLFANFLSKGRYSIDSYLSLMRNCSKLEGNCDKQYPFIWERFQSEGFHTVYLEDSGKNAVFKWKLPGLDYQWTDNLPIETFGNNWLNDQPYCIRNRKYHQILTRLVFDFMQTHQRLFIWLNLSFGSNNKDLLTLDTFLDELLGSVQPDNRNNWAILLASDHGRTIGDYDEVINDYQHRFNPVAYLMLPANFSRMYPQVASQINTMRDSLINHNALYEVMYSFASLQNGQEILKNALARYQINDTTVKSWRCPDDFPEELCPCKRTDIQRRSLRAERLIDYVLTSINEYFRVNYVRECGKLVRARVLDIVYVDSLQVYKLRFKVSVRRLSRIEDLFEAYVQVIRRQPRKWKLYRLTQAGRKGCHVDINIHSAMLPFCFCE